jgi:hypothetical protein
MSVMHWATLHARLMGWSGKVDAGHLADLMDAIHNIPELVQDWERCDLKFLRESFFRAYDTKWSAVSGFSMCATFDDALSKHDTRAQQSVQPDRREDAPPG